MGEKKVKGNLQLSLPLINYKSGIFVNTRNRLGIFITEICSKYEKYSFDLEATRVLKKIASCRLDKKCSRVKQR